MADPAIASQPAELPVESAAAPAAQEQQASPAAAIREDQVANAVAFLTHPKVRESPAATKRSFLERKGLTAAEIDEAFRRVPEPTSSATSPLSVPSQNAATGLITYQPLQQGATSPATMPASSAATTSSLQVVPARPDAQQQLAPWQQQQQQQHPQQQLAQPAPPEPIRWSQVVLGVGVVAAAVYAVKALVLPPAQEWYRQWCEKSKAQREAHERQQAALLEAVESLKSCQAELKAGSEAMQEMARAFREQQVQQAAALALERGRDTMSGQELRTELSTLKALVLSSTHMSSKSPAPHHLPEDDYSGFDAWGTTAPGRSSKPQAPWQTSSSGQGPSRAANGVSTGHAGGHTGGGHTSYSSMVNSYPPEVPPPPRGYLGGWGSSNGPLAAGSAAGSATGTPAYGHASPALPPSVSGSGYAAAADARGKPVSTNLPALPQSLAGEELRPGTGQSLPDGTSNAAAAGSSGPEKAPYPPSFHEVMEMVAKGITPPNVRTDIKDTPPDPSHPPSQSLMTPRPKPWEMRPSSASPPAATMYGQQGGTTQGQDPAAQPAGSAYASGNTWAAPLPGGVDGWSIHNSSGMNEGGSSAVADGAAFENGADHAHLGNGSVIANMNSSNTPFSSASADYQPPAAAALPTPAYQQHPFPSSSISSSQQQSGLRPAPWATAASSNSQAGSQNPASAPSTSASAPVQPTSGGSSLISSLVKSRDSAAGWKPPPPPLPTLTRDSSSLSPSKQPPASTGPVEAAVTPSSQGGPSYSGVVSGAAGPATSAPAVLADKSPLEPSAVPTSMPSHAPPSHEDPGRVRVSLVPDGDSEQLRAQVVVSEPEPTAA